MVLFDLLQKKGPGRSAVTIPAGFEPLADALRYNGAVIAAAHEIGRLTAGDGASLDERISRAVLRDSFGCHFAPTPSFSAASAST